MMKIAKTLILSALLLIMANNSFCQALPPAYQGMFNEIVKNFEQIRGSNSITQGKTILGLVNENKISLRVEHKKQLKNLTFENLEDEEGGSMWKATNDLAIDMVNKYEDFLTKEVEKMYKLSQKKSQE